MNIFETEWSVVYNMGVKCNALDITKEAGIRYFSSPWDTMDSCRGMVDTAKLMASGFDKYMDDISDWCVDPANPKRRTSPRENRNIQRRECHVHRPELFYPHVNYEWVSKYITNEEYEMWRRNERGLDLVWKGFSETFIRRQDRMTSILRSENKVLLLRIDVDNREQRRIRRYSTTQHINEFMETMTEAYPKKDWGFLYMYCGENRNLSCDYDNCHLELIPPGKSSMRSGWIVNKLKDLEVLPREEMKPYNFKEEA